MRQHRLKRRELIRSGDRAEHNRVITHMATVKYKVVRVGGYCDGVRNILRVSAKSRRNLRIETGTPVMVKCGKKAAVAIVEKIDREFVGIRNVCILTQPLGQAIDATVDSLVTIEKKVSDKAYKDYENKVLAAIRERDNPSAEEETTEEEETEG
jgi:hypothetical protein